jgi:hypothetical protein
MLRVLGIAYFTILIHPSRIIHKGEIKGIAAQAGVNQHARLTQHTKTKFGAADK